MNAEQKLKIANEIIEELVYQFANASMRDGVAGINDCGLSALESAFDYLGWDSFHPVPELLCELCKKDIATCGSPAPAGYEKKYYRCCGECFGILQK